MECIPAVRKPPGWKPQIDSVMIPNAQLAIEAVNSATKCVCIFTDGSHISGKVGAAADLWIDGS
jgi:hypothetical protein